ncbi:MAG: radical SAM/SPASM domain-containing protein [Cyclobacteriaceae bacterium]
MYISISDTFQLASKLSFKRIKNACQIYWSFTRSRIKRSSNIVGLPLSISVEPTTACNLRCPECPSGLRSFTRPTGKLSTELFDKLIEEIHETLFYLIFYFQGEPYLHPEFLQMVAKAKAKKIYTATSTNAHFLDSENAKKTVLSGLDRMIISIDGASQQTYEAYRKTGKLDKVIDGTKNILKWRKKLKSKTPAVVWQFLVVKPNEHEIETIRKLSKELGVDKVAFKTAQIYDYANGNPLIPTIDKYSRYRKVDENNYELKHKIFDECWKMWHSCVVTWDGKVVPCCFDKDAHFTLGNIQHESFETVWNSSSYNSFRNQLLNGRKEIEMCKNCTEGGKVWV